MSGASSRQWVGMQLLEVLLPLLAIIVLVFALLILFQPFFQREMITSHITTFDREDASLQIWQSVNSQTTADFGITIPQTSQAFIQNVELNSNEWLSMILKSLRQTFVLLVGSVSIITLVVVTSHCFIGGISNGKTKNQLNIPGLFYLAANDLAAKETLAHFLQTNQAVTIEPKWQYVPFLSLKDNLSLANKKKNLWKSC